MKAKNPHILLVEDNTDHVDLIREAFKSHSKKVNLSVAGNIQAARARLAESVPDLAIVDLLLPDGHGTDLLPDSGNHPPFPRC